jgi:hypothetical protein
MKHYRLLYALCILAISIAGCAPSPGSADALAGSDVPYVRPPGYVPSQWETKRPSSNTSASSGDLRAPDGKPAALQFPPDRYTRNTAGTDGLGLCVFTSMKHAGDWQNADLFVKQLEFMRRQPGGGYPSKVDSVLKAASKQYGLTIPQYVQVQDRDIEVLKLAIKNGYMPCVTYGISPSGRYSGKQISHMVNLIHADDHFFGVLDNNYVGPNEIEWMTPAEFMRAYTTNGRSRVGGVNGWAIVLLTASPPKPPLNR